MIVIGTSYFVSMAKAVRYYRDYEGDDRSRAALAVDRKIADGSIHIGQPPLQDGDILRIIDNGCRYAIERSE